MIYWVLDCWVLASCNDEECDNDDHYLECISLLSKIKERDGICLDHCGQIYTEYCKHFISRFVTQWWKVMSRTQGKIHYCSNNLSLRHLNNIMKIGFHDDDLKYIGTTYNSPNKKLVACESDYKIEIIDYLKDKCDIEVLEPCSCYTDS